MEIYNNSILYIFVWLYLANAHHFQFPIDLFIRINGMTCVYCGKCQNILVNTIISDKRWLVSREIYAHHLIYVFLLCTLSLYSYPIWNPSRGNISLFWI